MIASALRVGISKKELLEEYYLDEIGAVIEEYVALMTPGKQAKTEKSTDGEYVGVLDFLGGGGEIIDS